MSFRTCLLTIAILFSITAHAQDKIYKKDGSVFDAIVRTVSDNTIIFKRFDYPNGQDYTILRKEVLKIVYQNGVVDNFGDAAKPHGNVRNTMSHIYGNNMLSVIPGAYTVALDGTINDAGIGICYERQLDERGHISFNLPVIISFSSNKDYGNNGSDLFFSGNYNASYNTGNTYTSFNFMPGIKFYPGRNNEMVRYALGISFFVLTGNEPYGVFENSSQYQGGTPADFEYTMFGFMISNSVSIKVSRHLFFALEANVGVPLSDNRRQGVTAADNFFLPWMQYLLKIGYRF